MANSSNISNGSIDFNVEDAENEYDYLRKTVLNAFDGLKYSGKGKSKAKVKGMEYVYNKLRRSIRKGDMSPQEALTIVEQTKAQLLERRNQDGSIPITSLSKAIVIFNNVKAQVAALKETESNNAATAAAGVTPDLPRTSTGETKVGHEEGKIDVDKTIEQATRRAYTNGDTAEPEGIVTGVQLTAGVHDVDETMNTKEFERNLAGMPVATETLEPIVELGEHEDTMLIDHAAPSIINGIEEGKSSSLSPVRRTPAKGGNVAVTPATFTARKPRPPTLGTLELSSLLEYDASLDDPEDKLRKSLSNLESHKVNLDRLITAFNKSADAYRDKLTEEKRLSLTKGLANGKTPAEAIALPEGVSAPAPPIPQPTLNYGVRESKEGVSENVMPQPARPLRTDIPRRTVVFPGQEQRFDANVPEEQPPIVIPPYQFPGVGPPGGPPGGPPNGSPGGQPVIAGEPGEPGEPAQPAQPGADVGCGGVENMVRRELLEEARMLFSVRGEFSAEIFNQLLLMPTEQIRQVVLQMCGEPVPFKTQGVGPDNLLKESLAGSLPVKKTPFNENFAKYRNVSLTTKRRRFMPPSRASFPVNYKTNLFPKNACYDGGLGLMSEV